MKKTKIKFCSTRRSGDITLFVNGQEVKPTGANKFELDYDTASKVVNSTIPLLTNIIVHRQVNGVNYRVTIFKCQKMELFVIIDQFGKLNKTMPDATFNELFLKSKIIKKYTKGISQDKSQRPEVLYLNYKTKTIKFILNESDKVISQLITELN